MDKLFFAKSLRQNQTETEKLLWFHNKPKNLNGYKFKRQVVIGNYIADFVCYEKMVIIELDGGQHNNLDEIIKDKKRTEYLESLGFKVIRFWDNEVFNHIDVVLEVILSNLSTSP